VIPSLGRAYAEYVRALTAVPRWREPRECGDETRTFSKVYGWVPCGSVGLLGPPAKIIDVLNRIAAGRLTAVGMPALRVLMARMRSLRKKKKKTPPNQRNFKKKKKKKFRRVFSRETAVAARHLNQIGPARGRLLVTIAMRISCWRVLPDQETAMAAMVRSTRPMCARLPVIKLPEALRITVEC